MSRLSEILGVPEGREFRYAEMSPIYRVRDEFLEYKEGGRWLIVRGAEIYLMIAHPQNIKFLTEQQITAIKGRIAEGTLWAARNVDRIEVNFYSDKPKKDSVSGNYGIANVLYNGYSVSELFDFITVENSPVYLPDLIGEWRQLK